MKIRFILLIIIVITSSVSAQYKVPFCTKGNVIELNINNDVGSNTFPITIQAANLPDWLEFTSDKVVLSDPAPGKTAKAVFYFNVKNNAPTGKDYNISFLITDSKGNRLHKFINISVSGPDKYMLYQNYPNPFNPSTTIGFTLPKDDKVTLSIYNILGEKITDLINEVRKAGYHEVIFNASSVRGELSSGIYFYSIKTNEFSAVKKFTILK